MKRLKKANAVVVGALLIAFILLVMVFTEDIVFSVERNISFSSDSFTRVK